MSDRPDGEAICSQAGDRWPVSCLISREPWRYLAGVYQTEAEARSQAASWRLHYPDAEITVYRPRARP